MMKYIDHLSKGGDRRPADDAVYANVYTKRSAAFKDLKTVIAQACREKDWDTAKKSCQSIVDKHAEIASLWQIEPEKLKVQNMKNYRLLIDADISEDADQETKNNTKKIVGRIMDDAEKDRLPWQVGKDLSKSRFEPLDEDFLEEMLTGTRPASSEQPQALVQATAPVEQPAPTEEPIAENSFAQFETSLAPSFISAMDRALTADDVCKITKVPVSTMQVFVKALNPDFAWEDLGQQFKIVVLRLLKERSNRVESRPSATMLRMR
jgi:hypothetical protein